MLSVLSSVILQGCKEEWSLFPFNGDMLVQLGEESGIWDEDRQWQQVGLPRQPYYVELALSLITWKNTGSLSYLNYNDFFGLTPDSSVIGKLESLYESLIVCFNNFPPTDDNGELKSNWKSFFGVRIWNTFRNNSYLCVFLEFRYKECCYITSNSYDYW